MGITLVLTTAVLGVVLDVIALTCNIIVPCDIKSISPPKILGENSP